MGGEDTGPRVDDGWIIVKGARTHNLRDIDVKIPRGRFVVVSGVSGSGKSSLAFDTLYAEGQRRYVESLSSYARQFLGQMKKPDCDSIEGLSPAISIDQKQGSHNPRSTVATTTEIQDYLRLLYARVGKPHCPECGKEVARRTVQEIVDDIDWRMEQHAVAIWSPTIRNRKGTHADLFTQLVEQGYLFGKVNGRDVEFDDPPTLEKNLRHDIDVRIDRLRIIRENRQRLTEAVESGLRLGGGTVAIESITGCENSKKLPSGSKSVETNKGEIIPYSEEFACPTHGAFMPEMSPRIFSFNNPLGACPSCHGLGVDRAFSLDLLINEERSIEDGCVRPFQSSMMSGWYRSQMCQVAEKYNFETDIPYSQLDDDAKDILLNGSGSTEITFKFESEKGSVYQMVKPWEGVFNRLMRTYRETDSDRNRNRLQSYMVDQPCTECDGQKLNPAVRSVTVGGLSLPELSQSTVLEALIILQKWRLGIQDKTVWSKLDKSPPKTEYVSKSKKLGERDLFIAREVLKEIESRIRFLALVGLDYLTLDRRSNTLSGGESQRIRLATQIGTRLTGVTYVLDEPSIGLHARDNQRLLSTLRELCEIGNTLLVIEHDEETLRQADWLVDLGPGAGREGGRLLVSGPLETLLSNEESVTGAYLSGRRKISVPEKRIKPNGDWLKVTGAAANNLREIDVQFPLSCMVAVTGVSGSGKSTLVSDILAPTLLRDLHGSDATPSKHKSITGAEDIDKVIVIDQSPIGRTPRSNCVTYTKAFDEIRKLFASTPLAKERGYKPGQFSFNVRGGRCEACSGGGSVKMEMHFLADVWVTCEICEGSRYTRETLEVVWKRKSIADVLDMSVNEACKFFSSHNKLHRIVKTLQDVGLGYIRLGQPATTLSGGEAQRVKLATQLHRPANRHTIYILDEPTTGLALSDIQLLIDVLLRIRSNGHTIIVIEHHLDVIKSCDWVIDLGPDGGDGGGSVVATGTPEQIAANKKSYTGNYLKHVL
ncbi:MAG: excinuclease ABC subunit UvrA [Euryarchaeota archaeon]|jgi:excinuclease ABC subunit A|nr:excinuclease ABC subunit UvrA [Euryarchaeota archaeon]